ncbi:hypothetical protein BDR06DRAFT_966784 [Suillus hirtellus]|nr:hypothetical protein BDR06DRAFT_966784 [Suillus hirtellus]
MACTRSLGCRFSSHDPPVALQPKRKRNIKSKTKKDHALTCLWCNSRSLYGHFSFHAELVMDESLTKIGTQITYCALEEVVAFDFDTQRKHTTCCVPVMEGGRLRGYVPLPMRYWDIWLELSYNIVLLMNIWELWSKEEGKALRPKEKKMVTACQQNIRTLLVQYMLSRLLAVEELVSLSYNIKPSEECMKSLNEWKVWMLWDWFDMTHSEAKADGSEFMCADPARIENKAFFERRWEIEDDGSDILSLQADPNLWIHGHIKGLDDIFKKQLNLRLSKRSASPANFLRLDMRKGPIYQHIGMKGMSLVHSSGVSRNDYWNSPIDLLHHVLSTDPAYHDLEQFLGDLCSLAGIITVNPEWEDIKEAAKYLWLGKIIWRGFTFILTTHVDRSSIQDDQNTFNTLEAHLVFEGYMRGGKNQKAQSDRDVILWKGLNQMGPQEYWPLHDNVVMEVLEKAGTWWQDFRCQQVKETNVTEQPEREEDDACSDAMPEIELQVHDQQQGGSGEHVEGQYN